MQRNTKQRQLVLNCLANFSGFMSIQEIHNELTKSEEKIGLSTVYRIIGEMHSAKQVDMMQSDSGEALYRLCSANHHHHLVCAKCGNTKEIFDDEVESWAQVIARKNKFKLVDHNVELIGICSTCN